MGLMQFAVACVYGVFQNLLVVVFLSVYCMVILFRQFSTFFTLIYLPVIIYSIQA